MRVYVVLIDYGYEGLHEADPTYAFQTKQEAEQYAAGQQCQRHRVVAAEMMMFVPAAVTNVVATGSREPLNPETTVTVDAESGEQHEQR